LTLVLPFTAKGSFFLDARVAVAAFLALMAAAVPAGGLGRGAALGALALALALGGARTAAIAADWRAQDARYAELLRGLEALPEGALVIPAEAAGFQFAEGWTETRTRTPPYEHAAAYAVITRGALVTNLFARRGQNPLVHEADSELSWRVGRNPIARAHEPEALAEYLADAEAVADGALQSLGPVPTYLAVLRAGCGGMPAGPRLQAVACGEEFALLRIDPLPPPGEPGADEALVYWTAEELDLILGQPSPWHVDSDDDNPS
jgi:hypothetical protein